MEINFGFVYGLLAGVFWGSGDFLGALFPALQATGISDAKVRRAWAAFRGGVWQIGVLLPVWQDLAKKACANA